MSPNLLIFLPGMEDRVMKSSVIKRSIIVDGHKTSVSLEDAFWNCLRDIAKGEGKSLTHVVSSIDTDRDFANLSSAIRLFVLGYYRDQLGRLSAKTDDPISARLASLQ